MQYQQRVQARHFIKARNWKGLASSWEVLVLAGRECVGWGSVEGTPALHFYPSPQAPVSLARSSC